MAWNFLEPIATMPGPQFLLLYGCVIALTLALCRWVVRRPDLDRGAAATTDYIRAESIRDRVPPRRRE